MFTGVISSYEWFYEIVFSLCAEHPRLKIQVKFTIKYRITKYETKLIYILLEILKEHNPLIITDQ